MLHQASCSVLFPIVVLFCSPVSMHVNPHCPILPASGSHSRESFPFSTFGSFSSVTLFATCLLAMSCLCEVFAGFVYFKLFCDFVSLSLYRLWLPIPS